MRLDIRHLIQVGMPRDIEEYSQQIGRAGRDGNEAKCTLYVSPSDYKFRKDLEIKFFPSRDAVRHLVRDLFEVRCRGLDVGATLTLNPHEQANNNKYDRSKWIDAWTVEYVYAALELRFGLLQAFARREVPGELRDDAKSYLEQYGANARFRLAKVAPAEVDVSQVADDVFDEMKVRLDERIWRALQVMQLVSGQAGCVGLGLVRYFSASLPGGMAQCMRCSCCLRNARGILPEAFEADIVSYSQLVAEREREAAWAYSQVPATGVESESEDDSR